MQPVLTSTPDRLGRFPLFAILNRNAASDTNVVWCLAGVRIAQVRVRSPVHQRRAGRTAPLLVVAQVDRIGGFGESVWSAERTQS